MALRKSDDIANESDSRYNRVKDSKKVVNITERFDDTTHNDNPYDDAIQYLAKKVDDIIDETNVQTLASGSLATRVTAEETKNSPSVETVALAMSVDRSNNLVISSGTGDSQITWTIAADR